MNTPIWVDWCVTISFGVWNEPSDNLTPNLNGQRVLTPDQWWVMMSFLMSFFWCSKVMQMLSARWRVWLACEICLLPLKNLMFLIHCVFSWPEFLRYLQECIVKKKAPKNSLHRISSFFYMEILWNSEPATATLGETGLSFAWYIWSWHCRMNASCLSRLRLGSAWSANL